LPALSVRSIEGSITLMTLRSKKLMKEMAAATVMIRHRRVCPASAGASDRDIHPRLIVSRPLRASRR